MKIRLIIIGLLPGLLIGFGLTKIFTAATNRSASHIRNATTWKWADSLDAVKAAPNSHHIIFENDKIRVLEVTLNPHSQEPMHTHRWSSIMFGNNNGDTSQFDIIYSRYDYDSINHKYFVRDSIKQHNGGSARQDDNEESNLMLPEGPHSITNLSNVKIDVYRIEFKPDNK